MAGTRRFLVVEDGPGWVHTFETALLALIPDAQVEHAGAFDAALHKVANGAYDVVITDLLLPRSGRADDMPEELGQELARRVRADPRNRHAGMLVVTAYATPARTRDAFRGCDADDFIDKYGYTSGEFLAAVRGALRASALRRARYESAGAVRLEIQVSATEVAGARVAGRSHASYPGMLPLPLQAADWAARADALNAVLLGPEPDHWRDAARALGQELFEYLAHAPQISAAFASARSAALSPGELCVQLWGPPAAIGVPFELMRDANGEYMVFRHQLVRGVTAGAGAVSRKTSRFCDLVEKATAAASPLRVLVVGANADGTLRGAEEEARRIRLQLETELDRLGVPCEVTALIGADATVANVRTMLAARDTHLFHYAGHGRFDRTLPEVGGLVLGSDSGPVSLRASDLYLLCKDSPLHLVFLSCCLSARAAAAPHRGDFDGVFDALTKADVPTVLGYRWVVGDESALSLATAFYDGLFRTLSPSSALFQARSQLAMRELGWYDETWLSPILVEQNP
jgi:CheY-like chemotaxis protein